MSGVSRRAVLKGGAVAGAVAAVPLASGGAQAAPALVVFDSRIPESADFARRAPGQHWLDLAQDHRTRHSGLRGNPTPSGTVEGLTGWSDWVAVRGELEARGLRLVSEDRVTAPLSGKAHLFRWTMQAR